jgi:hypothetical protein
METAMTEALIGYGTIFAVESAPGSGSYTQLGEVTSVTPPNLSVDQIDATHMQSPGRTREFIQGLADPGEMSIEMNYIANSATDAFLLAWRTSGLTRSARISYPGSATDTFPAFILGYAPGSIDPSDKMSATLSLKVAGAVVRG